MFFFLTIVDAFLTNSFVFEKAMNKQLLFVKYRFEVTLCDNF